MKTKKARSRALLLGLTATATAIGGIAGIQSQALSAPPAEDCAVAHPVADLLDGQAVSGMTVSSGVTPEGFTGEVLGVIENGIAFDVDMVVVRLQSAEIDRVGGIWAGMSGSPVYAADGRLIGAVAYGLSWGPSPVAGVTPFEDMDEHLAAPARQVAVSGALARRIARTTDVTAAQAEQGLAQLPMPMTVSGTSRWAISKSGTRPYLGPVTAARAGTSAAQTGPADLVAGGNLGLTWAYGDVTGGGVGTVTSVCGDRLVGFGHPAEFLGADTTFSMHPADAVYVQEDSLGTPYKVANLGLPAGTITGDHLTGVSGVVGPTPTTAPVRSTVTFGARSRTGVTHVSVPQGMASATFYELAGNHTRVLDGSVSGTSVTTWTVTGTRADGSTFSLTRGDRYTGSDVVSRSVWDLPDLVWMLGDFPGVTVTSVEHDADVNSDQTTYQVGKVQYRRDGRWVRVREGGRIVAKAGRDLQGRVVLKGSDGSLVRHRFGIAVAKKFAGTSAELSVVGGQGDYYFYEKAATGRFAPRAATVDGFLENVAGRARNDQVTVEMYLEGRTGMVKRQDRSAPQDHVVEGSKWFRVRIR